VKNLSSTNKQEFPGTGLLILNVVAPNVIIEARNDCIISLNPMRKVCIAHVWWMDFG
jgi:hypothetical protein